MRRGSTATGCSLNYTVRTYYTISQLLYCISSDRVHNYDEVYRNSLHTTVAAKTASLLTEECLCTVVVVVVALVSVDLEVWKHLTRWPTSGLLLTRDVRNLCTSSFLHSASQWYSARALTTVKRRHLGTSS